MKLFSEKIGNYLLYIILVLEIILLGIIGGSKHQDVSFDNDAVNSINDNWIYSPSETEMQILHLPAKLVVQGKDSFIISRVLPDYLPSDWVIATLSSYNIGNAYLDNIIIYSNKGETDMPFDLAPGSIWNIIRLPKEAAGKTLELEILLDQPSFSNVLNEVYLGPKAEFLMHILHSRGLNFLISTIILCIGLNLILVFLALYKFLKNNKSILYLGFFSVLISLWMIMESSLMQFLIENQYLISTIKYLSLMTQSIPMLLFLSLLFSEKSRKIVIKLAYLFIGYVFLMMLLQVLNLLNFRDGLLSLHLMIIGVFSIVLIILCLELIRHKNKDLKHLTISLLFLFTFSFLEIVAYNFDLGINTGNLLQFGVLFFLTIVSWSSLHKAIEIVRLSEEAKHFEQLATIDYMTKCKNRTAYSTQLEQISYDHTIAIVLADVNNMKYINDTFGHPIGDEVIVKCSECLLKILGNNEYCYRIGGDEFVCILYDQSIEDVERKKEAFIHECSSLASTYAYPFEVSLGYAFYDQNIDQDIYDTVKRADKNMYHFKMSQKLDLQKAMI